MHRRDIVKLALAATVAPWRALAQPTATKLVGAIIGAAADDPAGIGFAQAVRDGLAQEGWVEGLNLRLEVRFAPVGSGLADAYAAELLALGSDAFLCGTLQNAVAVRALTREVPIVFVAVFDPIAGGLVDSYARPGGNATGFTSFEPTIGGRWVAMLKEIVPTLSHAMYMDNPTTVEISPTRTGRAFAEAAASLGVEPIMRSVRSIDEIEPAIAELASFPSPGFVLGYDNFMFANRPTVLAAINRHRVPAIYGFQNYADEGGLIAYAVDTRYNFMSGGVLVGRILDGARPQDIPVQAPARFVLVVNLRAAMDLRVTIPVTMIATADRVIE